MDFQHAKAPSGPKWAWARTGAIILFLLTGILLLASLHAARSQSTGAPAGEAVIHSERT